MSGSDQQIARELAQAAGALLLDLRTQRGYDDPDALRKAGDRRSHDFLIQRLRAQRPDDHVLSEEADDDPARTQAQRVWIVDPLDGTREFGEAGRSDWAVHVALLADGELVAGAVGLPAQGRTLTTEHPPPLTAAVDRPPRLAVSRSRPGAESGRLAERLGGKLVPMGSAGAKAMAVVSGEVDVYAHSGGQYLWDSAAPVAVARASGLHTSRLDGSSLRYDSESTWLPDLVICRPELADRVLSILGEERS
jgi:3'(2'), 5'-bisphosphate nucleotidase